jgi:dGTP triphosphohydrolase
VVTGKWYLGMHSTDNLDDGYFGSGVHLWKSIRKHGKEAHIVEILEMLENRKSLAAREEELLIEAKKNPLCMNIALSSQGFTDRPTAAKETREKMSLAQTARWEKFRSAGMKRPKQAPAVIANRVAKNTGQKRTEETRQRMSEAQQLMRTNESSESKQQRSSNMAAAKSKNWIIEDTSGATQCVKNLKAFALAHGLNMHALYGSFRHGKPVSGFKVVGKIKNAI